MSMSWAWDKEKNPRQGKSPTGFKPMTSQTPGGCSIHLSYWELMVNEAKYQVHICILLGSAMSTSCCVLSKNETNKMWKWNNQHVTSVRQRNNLSPQQDSLVTCWLFHFHICFTELKILDFWIFQGHATVQHVVGKCLEWWQCNSKPFEQIHYGSIAMIIP